MGGRNCEEEVGIFEELNLGADHFGRRECGGDG